LEQSSFSVYALGRHRLMHGSALLSSHKKALLEDAQVDLILTDPPYCSGSHQEAGKAGSNSIGTSSVHGPKPKIASDNLSTLGYIGLLAQALTDVHSAEAYIFTDWRMWPWTLQAIEGMGLATRNLLVWDKGTPGMGVRWRNQHELILWGRRRGVEDKSGRSHGNVVRFPRSGNKDHPTQKPVDLLCTLLQISREAHTVFDPFAGSGSTLLACEREGRTGYAMEIDERFVQNTLVRWERETGIKPEQVA
jgi:DNA modification methylase